LKQKLSNLRRQ